MTYILIALGCLILWKLYKNNKVVDHTADPLSIPCPCCQTASVMGPMGYYHCPSCKSQWLPRGTWVLKFTCDNCNSRPSKITQDFYNENLFRLEFPCGRVGRYNHDTKAKCDLSPCRHALLEKLQETEDFTSNCTTEEECGTPIQSSFEEDSSIDDYPPPSDRVSVG